VASGRPYAGFSAGSAVAAEQAIVGGYRLAGRVVCPEDAGEDLDPVTVVPGLGLTPFAVDVPAAQWGTLGRLQATVAAGLVPAGVAIDEDTALVLEYAADDLVGGTVVGSGTVHFVQPQGDAVTVRTYTAGQIVPVPNPRRGR
jgi:cyanophycinase